MGANPARRSQFLDGSSLKNKGRLRACPRHTTMRTFQFAFDAEDEDAGDEDGKTLHLCGRSGFYSMRLKIAGVRP